MKITKHIHLDESLSLEIERVDNAYGFIEKHFYLNDSESEIRRKLAVFTNGKWASHNPGSLNQLFEISKRYRSRIIRSVHKSMDFEHEVSIQTRFNCFKRTFKIQATKLTHKAKIKTTDAIQNIFR
jgi:hypothetical protein